MSCGKMKTNSRHIFENICNNNKKRLQPMREKRPLQITLLALAPKLKLSTGTEKMRTLGNLLSDF